MPTRVGRFGSEGKPAVETKPRETVLSLCLPTRAKAKANSDPQICMQHRNVAPVGASHRSPMTSTCVSADFHACSCSSTASRRRSSSAHGIVLAITSRTIEESMGVVNDNNDPEWIRAKGYLDQTVESMC